MVDQERPRVGSMRVVGIRYMDADGGGNTSGRDGGGKSLERERRGDTERRFQAK